MDVNVTPVPPEPERDAGKIDSADLPFRMFPDASGKRAGGFQVLMRQSVLNEIYRHGRSVDRIEVGGMLVGNVYRDASGPFLSIEAVVRGEQAAARDTQVTFTAETWQHIQKIMDDTHPTKRIVGWYHTHPGFGIFLSDMDVFIHENFFSLAWQTAFVFDPLSLDEGVFVWRDGKPVREPFMIEADEPKLELKPELDSVPARTNTLSGAVDADLLDRLGKIERTQRLLIALLIIVWLISVLWPIVFFTIAPGGSNVPAEPESTQPVYER